MSEFFSVEVTRKGDISIILPAGYIDADSIEKLEQAFNEVKDTGDRKLIFNFTNTKKINSTGMSYILAIVQETIDRGIKVSFSNLSRINQKLFSMIGIDEFGKIVSDEQEALISFDQE